MKRISLLGVTLLSAVVFAGCSNGDSAKVKELEEKIEKLQSKLDDSSTDETSEDEDEEDEDFEESSSSSEKSYKSTKESSSENTKSSESTNGDLELFDGEYKGGDSYLPTGRYNLEFVGKGYNSISNDDGFWENNNGGGEKIHGIEIEKGLTYSISGDVKLTKTKKIESSDGVYALYGGKYIGGEDLPTGTYDLSFIGSGYNSFSDENGFWENNNGGDERYHGVVIEQGEIYTLEGELELTLLQ
ncbi:hypothetical protein [Enterococcus sp. LJL51]|uniref:hypothetical protein n=1 Tax=Enterococcus sp. LJL51 TaxID=3416656 RepID=UPI003CFB8A47